MTRSKKSPVLVVGSNLRGNIGIGENGQVAVRFWNHSSALDILIISVQNVHRWLAHGLQQLRSGMFVEHPFAECTKLLPLVTAVLDTSCQEAQWQDAD